MRLDIYHHADQRVVDKLDLLLATGEIMMDTIDRLIEDVAKQKTVIDSTTALIVNLKHQVAEALASAKLPPEAAAKLALIFPDLEANTASLAAALTDNTPSAPVPQPPADPAPTPPIATGGEGQPAASTDPVAPATL